MMSRLLIMNNLTKLLNERPSIILEEKRILTHFAHETLFGNNRGLSIYRQ
jgi:hypothetical protein